MLSSDIKKIYVAGTFDTKGDELSYIAQCLLNAGLQTLKDSTAGGVPAVVTVDLSTGKKTSSGITDIAAHHVASHHSEGADAVLSLTDRGLAVTAMASAFENFLSSRTDVVGVVGAGGSGGTALLAPALRTLPVGVPKVLVSTVASGNVAPYVGASDITLMYSVTDVEGLNRISRQVLGNAAHALAGMVLHGSNIDTTSVRPVTGFTMFGVTTPCVKAVTAVLNTDNDCLVFHATGTGGTSMEKLVDSGLISAVLDITTTEVADMLVGGVFAATEDRMGAVIRSGCPYIGSVGALDMVNFGARDTVPERFNDRLFHVHNQQVTLMRTTAEENRQFGDWIGDRLNRMNGPVRFLIPEHGVSMLDADGQPFRDEGADSALFDALEAKVIRSDNRQLIRVPAHINDPAFSDTVVQNFNEIVP